MLMSQQKPLPSLPGKKGSWDATRATGSLDLSENINVRTKFVITSNVSLNPLRNN